MSRKRTARYGPLRTLAVGLPVAVLGACATTPPPPPPMVEAGLFVLNLPKQQTIEFVSIPSGAACTVMGDKNNDLGSFSGRKVMLISHFNEEIRISCTSPGFQTATRTVPAEKTQAGSGVGAVVLIGILAGPAAAASTAARMRRERSLWWYPPIVHVVLAPDPGAAHNQPKKRAVKPKARTAKARIAKAAGGKASGGKVAGDADPDPMAEVAAARKTVKARWEAFISSQTKICDQPKPYYRYCVKRDFPRFRDKDLAAIGVAAD